MASAVTQQLFSSTSKISFLPAAFSIIVRNSSRTPKQKQKRGTTKFRNLIQSDCQSLADRGFLRSQKPYNPPHDASEKVQKIAETFLGTEYKFDDSIPKSLKFPVLEECWKVFKYGIPNSQLHKINNINDIIQFYITPIKTITPFDTLKDMVLPPNLHIQYDYIRFDPKTDVKFNGITAYPESSTIIVSLKGRKKYKDVPAKLPFYYYNESYYKKIDENN